MAKKKLKDVMEWRSGNYLKKKRDEEQFEEEMQDPI